jgi:hypothetical protein
MDAELRVALHKHMEMILIYFHLQDVAASLIGDLLGNLLESPLYRLAAQ